MSHYFVRNPVGLTLVVTCSGRKHVSKNLEQPIRCGAAELAAGSVGGGAALRVEQYRCVMTAEWVAQ